MLGLYVAASNDVGGGCDQVVARFNFAVVCGRQPRWYRATPSWQPVAASSSAGVGSSQSWRGKSSTAAGSPAPASIQEWEAQLLDDMEDSDDTAHSSGASLPPLMPWPPDSALQPAAADADSQPPPPLTATPDDDETPPPRAPPSTIRVGERYADESEGPSDESEVPEVTSEPEEVD